MPLLNDKTGTGDPAVTELLSPSQEEFRQALRQRLIASRGSTYTYKDPDAVAGRAGGTIGDDGAINITIGRSGFNPAGGNDGFNNAGVPNAGVGGGDASSRGGGANAGPGADSRSSPFVGGATPGAGLAPRRPIPNNPNFQRPDISFGGFGGGDATDPFAGTDIMPGTDGDGGSGSLWEKFKAALAKLKGK